MIIIILRFDNYIAPKGSVTSFIATAYNSTCIKLEWKLPAVPNGVTGYKIYQWDGLYPAQVGNTSFHDQTANIVLRDQILRYSICTLRQNQIYFYQIIPYNIKYHLDGPASQIINATTKEDRKTDLIISYIKNVICVDS